MVAWEHCGRCKATVVGLWLLALSILIFIGWGCSSDTGPKDSSVQADSGIVDQGPGRVDAVDSGTDRPAIDSLVDPDSGQPSADVRGTDGSLADSAGDLRGDDAGPGVDGMGTGDSLSPQPDLGGADAFTPGVTQCGLPETPNPYFPCCPDGMDCVPIYGVRQYCSCTVQPPLTTSDTLHTCEVFQGFVNPKTTKYPTRCVR